MQEHILSVVKQTGSFSLDETACYQDMKDECDELFQAASKTPGVPQSMFRCVDGKIQIFAGGYDSFNEWGDGVNLWGFGGYDSFNKRGDSVNLWGVGERYFLKVLAKHLKGRGTITFSMDNEGNSPEAYTIKGNKVKKIF